ncbi:hypothetical protein [Flavobacterium sp.]|jgi:hypothetical protein|uniref:hypothetical protein n=1 Tax=Flavobacterium sp. TaxID=239 RepID=UPI003782EF54
MKNKSFGILILLLLGCFLILLSIFFLYQGINSNREEIQVTKNELNKAKKKIEKLSNLIAAKKSLSRNKDSVIARNSDEFKAMLGENVPLIEITDLDLLHKNKRSNRDESHVYKFRFYIFNVGKSSLKDVIVSIKDIYNDPKKIKIKSKTIGNLKNSSVDVNEQQIGTYENFNIYTLNLKSRRLVYATTMSKSYGSEEYAFDVIVEWKSGFYQINVKIQELDGNLKYEYKYYDSNGEPIDFKKLKSSILK